MPKRYSHIHKVKRVNIGKKEPYIVYRCMEPTCGFYKIPELVVGMEVICWKCDEPMKLTKDRMIVKPTCCTTKKKQDPGIDAAELLKGLMDDE